MTNTLRLHKRRMSGVIVCVILCKFRNCLGVLVSSIENGANLRVGDTHLLSQALCEYGNTLFFSISPSGYHNHARRQRPFGSAIETVYLCLLPYDSCSSSQVLVGGQGRLYGSFSQIHILVQRLSLTLAGTAPVRALWD